MKRILILGGGAAGSIVANKLARELRVEIAKDSYSLPLNQLGNMWYFCTYPGHAQDGMYGRIVVTG